jgi:hypothetical protein
MASDSTRNTDGGDGGKERGDFVRTPRRGNFLHSMAEASQHIQGIIKSGQYARINGGITAAPNGQDLALQRVGWNRPRVRNDRKHATQIAHAARDWTYDLKIRGEWRETPPPLHAARGWLYRSNTGMPCRAAQ